MYEQPTPEVLPTTDASYGKMFSRSHKMQARIASQRGFEVDSNNDNYRPEKEMYGGSMVPQRSSRMLHKARSIKTFNQNLANINKNRADNQPPPPPPPPPRTSEERELSENRPMSYPSQPVFASPTQAAMFEEFQERELSKLREINAMQKQREEEERLLREEQASARMRELRLAREQRLAMEREEERRLQELREADEERKRRELAEARLAEERREQERKEREEEARIQDLLTKQKKALKKKRLQDEIDALLDEEDLMEALQEQKQFILRGNLSEGDMAMAVERLQNLERYLVARQQGVPPPSPIRSNDETYSGRIAPRRRSFRRYSDEAIALMTDEELAQTTEDVRNELLDFDTKSEAELMDLHQILTRLEAEARRRSSGQVDEEAQQKLAKERRELQYRIQEGRNGAEVQKMIANQRNKLERQRSEEEEISDWAKANEKTKQEKLRELRLKDSQLKEEQKLQKERELQRAHEMRQRLIDEESRIEEQDRAREEKLRDEQLIREKEELVQKLQQKLDAEEQLRSQKEEYQRAKEMQLQKERLLQEKRRAEQERNASLKQNEMLEQKKTAAVLLQEKEALIAQLQAKVEEEERLKAKKARNRENSLRRQESLRSTQLKKQDSLSSRGTDRYLSKQVSFNSNVELGVYQKLQDEINPVAVNSDSDSESNDDRMKIGGRRVAHYSFRDGVTELDNENNHASDLYRQKRSGLRPVNPVSYRSRNGFDQDENTTDRNSQELKSAKFNYSNIGDNNPKREKKSSFRAYDNPMSKSSIPTSFSYGDAKKQPSVLSRWPPAQNGR